MRKTDDSLKFFSMNDKNHDSKCDFTGIMVGSEECKKCDGFMAINNNKMYVRCKKYRDEGRDYNKIRRPDGVAGGTVK